MPSPLRVEPTPAKLIAHRAFSLFLDARTFGEFSLHVAVVALARFIAGHVHRNVERLERAARKRAAILDVMDFCNGLGMNLVLMVRGRNVGDREVSSAGNR